MTKMRRIELFGITLISAALMGCGPKPTMEMMKKEMLKDRPRPAELDKLGMFVGSWESTGEMTMPGVEGKMSFTGTSNCEWDADKWCVMEHFSGTMEGKSFHGIGIYFWDAHDKKYHSGWLESSGRLSHADLTYDEAKRTWNMKSHDRDTTTGETSSGVGTIQMPDDNTMIWTGQMKNMWGMTMMEMKGTGKRK